MLLNASKDVNILEMELDYLKESNGLFKKVFDGFRKLRSDKEEKDDGKYVIEYSYLPYLRLLNLPGFKLMYNQ